MKIKNLITIISFFSLMGSATPLLANIVELQILPGAYRIEGPTEINFQTQASSTSANNKTISFRNIADTTPSQADKNYLLITDESGGNPFDVTVTVDEFKKIEPLSTTVISGSTNTNIKVASSAGFYPGDNITIAESNTIFELNIYTIAEVPDSSTLVLTESMGYEPPVDYLVNRVVRCNLNPRKCIPLSNFSISAHDFQEPYIQTINGNSDDFQINAETSGLRSFAGLTSTISGSSGTTLKVADSGQFMIGEALQFDSNSGVNPLYPTVVSIEDDNTITLDTAFISPPDSGVEVQSGGPRTLTLGNGTGYQPGEFKIHPILRLVVPAGQMTGSYQSVMRFNII